MQLMTLYVYTIDGTMFAQDMTLYKFIPCSTLCLCYKRHYFYTMYVSMTMVHKYLLTLYFPSQRIRINAIFSISFSIRKYPRISKNICVRWYPEKHEKECNSGGLFVSLEAIYHIYICMAGKRSCE